MLRRLGFSTFFLLLAFLFFHTATFAQSSDCVQVDSSAGPEKIQQVIDACNRQVSDSRKKIDTLASQIKYMDTQAYITELEISKNTKEVSMLTDEIANLGSRISELDTTLTNVSVAVNKKIVETYKQQQNTSTFHTLFNAGNLPALLRSMQYLQQSQKNDRNLLLKVQDTKVNFQEQKELREEKEIELKRLTAKLEQYKVTLAQQQQEKKRLLDATRNDEARYQTILSQALAERKAIDQATATGSRVGDVKKGDPIAIVGNSGYPYCSTGAHLHFEVHQNGQWVNAENYLSPKTLAVAVDDSNYQDMVIGSGSWDWPLSDPMQVNQRYGNTPWSYRYAYSGHVHTGIDLDSTGSQVIRAVADGVLYSSSQACGSATINIKFIDHGNGIMSYYLHVQ
ncbi:MAG: peptidoglycan DD-metalloendopeptidase family protein [Patescibacteria group bacterium]